MAKMQNDALAGIAGPHFGHCPVSGGVLIWLGAALARALEQIAEQGKAEGKGKTENVLHQHRAAFDALVGDVGFGPLRRDDRSHVLEEIDPALFTRAAVALFVGTGRALIAQRGMAARTEPSDFAYRTSAFRALHVSMLPGAALACRPARNSCDHIVNRVRSHGSAQTRVQQASS